MYPVSEAFLQAVQGNTRKYYWTGKNYNNSRAGVSVYAERYRQRERLYHSAVLRQF